MEFAQELLISRASSLGLALSAEQGEQFSDYLSLLLLWNARTNLTAIRNPLLVLRHHFLDSLALTPFLTPSGRLLDVGSGAGFPGLPLKIALPQKQVVLVESRRKRGNFLREVIRSLDLKGVEVIEGRAEEIDPREVGLFDEVVTRAFGSSALFLRLSFPLLSSQGRSMIMHGPKGEELFHRMSPYWKKLGYGAGKVERFLLPLGNEERSLLVFVKP